jgi:hypothetical protein
VSPHGSTTPHRHAPPRHGTYSSQPSPAPWAHGVRSTMRSAFKDIAVGPFDVVDKFFRPDGNFEAKLRHYFVDSGFTPLLVHENCARPPRHLQPCPT